MAMDITTSEEANLPNLLLFATDLANEKKTIDARLSAGYALMDQLDVTDADKKEQLAQQWMEIEDAIKSGIKRLLLKTLSSSAYHVRNTSAQVIAKVASIEIPLNQWPDLMKSLLNNINSNHVPETVKQATLETLGYVCEEISAQDLHPDEVNSVLNAFIEWMSPEHGPKLRLTATKALYNALDFAKTNFENETQRKAIMAAICENASSNEPFAFECLVSIAAMYYPVLGETVALQAFEVWSSIYDKEIGPQGIDHLDDKTEWNLGCIFELNEVIRSSNIMEISQTVEGLLCIIVQKLRHTLGCQIISEDYTKMLQASLCGVLQVIIQKHSSSADETESKSTIRT